MGLTVNDQVLSGFVTCKLKSLSEFRLGDHTVGISSHGLYMHCVTVKARVSGQAREAEIVSITGAGC